MTGVLQGCLLVMGITFELRARRERVADAGGMNPDGSGHADEVNGSAHGHINREEDHERTGLIGNER